MTNSGIKFLFISPEFDSMMNLKTILESRHQSLCCDVALAFNPRTDMSKYCLLAADIFSLSEYPLALLTTLRDMTYIPISVFVTSEQLISHCSAFSEADAMLSKMLTLGADMILPMNLYDTVTEYFGSFYKRHVFFQHQEQIRHRSTMIFRDELVIEPKLQLASKNGKKLELTSREFVLLNYLACNADHVITYDMIADRIWGSAEIINSAIFNAITRLRRKLEDDPQNPTYIQTIYNAGYMFKSHIRENSFVQRQLSRV